MSRPGAALSARRRDAGAVWGQAAPAWIGSTRRQRDCWLRLHPRGSARANGALAGWHLRDPAVSPQSFAGTEAAYGHPIGGGDTSACEAGISVLNSARETTQTGRPSSIQRSSAADRVGVLGSN